MSRICLLSLSIVLSLLIPSRLDAQPKGLDVRIDSLIIIGLSQVHAEKYDEAFETVHQITQIDPEGPVGYFGLASLYLLLMRNFRSRIFESRLDSLLDLAIEKGKSKGFENDPMRLFFLGASYGYRGLHRARKLDYFGAFLDGWRGLKNLKKAYKLDPNLYDVFLGFGIYHYWRSALSSILRWITFTKDHRQQGINEVKLAMEKGRYVNVFGRYILTEFYYNEKRNEESLELCEQLSVDFPTNPSWLYIRIRCLERLNRWEEAELLWRKLLNHIENSEYTSIGFLVECHYGLALCRYHQGDKMTAHKECRKALELSRKRDPDTEIEGPLESFKEIFKNLMSLMVTLNR